MHTTPIDPLFTDETRAREILDQTVAIVDRLSACWREFEPFADNTFLSSFRLATADLGTHNTPGPAREDAYRRFHRRWWEMDTAYSLLVQGIELVPRSQWDPAWNSAGPDLLAMMSGRRVWIECIAPDSGNGPDSVPPLPAENDFEVRTVPVKGMQLRFLSAIDKKRKQYQRHLQAGIISQDDAYVIALNAHAVSELVGVDGFPPWIARALYGLGDLRVGLDFKTGQVTNQLLEREPFVTKRNGEPISTDLFATGGAAEVSAVLYSSIDAWHYGTRLERIGILIPNITGRVQLPQRWLPALPSCEVRLEGNVGTIRLIEPSE